MKKIKKIIILITARTYFQNFFEFLHFIALKGMNYGSANEPKDSGENNLLKMMAKELPINAVIFDVGSNNGQYLELLLQNFNALQPTIHCFEPDDTAFAKLQKNFKNNKNVILNNFALGDQNMKSILFSDGLGDVKASLVDVESDNLIEKEIEIKRLDDYCIANKIDKINFLKIDTEGYEANVLIGSEKMIQSNCIERIQLEHGSMQTIIMGTTLYSLKKLLPRFNIFHIKQNGITKILYKPQMEIFYNSNYYFKLKN
ncbi:MAG: FkbM family methyltransferase [Flavobacterium sp.]|uniref:FkbM family methyltransferase n=1 Tax=Flavobacterium sp. TaxID=239 RepID=UPI003267DC38